MDKTTLADPAVTAALAGYIKIKFQAEDPDDATVKEVMQRFGAVGLPTYVILKPTTGDTVAFPENYAKGVLCGFRTVRQTSRRKPISCSRTKTSRALVANLPRLYTM